ncbi:MAG: hypothetical protein EOP90_03625 [Lysobacteraceae bacterium]|nr:MAG: hypothetical protein EOP90_03625 [Xanthomonadaceae bacterium]
MTLRTRFLLGCALGLPMVADAATRTWPGDPGCSGTLQACVDAAADGDRIEIATDVPITESIALHARSLTLTAADGYKPQFLGVGIIANDSGGGGADIDVRLSRLRFTNGYVTATYASPGHANFEFRELVLTRAPGATGAGITVIAYEGTVEAMLYDNRVSGLPLGINGALVELAAQGGTLDARAYYNHVSSTGPGTVEGAGLFVNVAQGGGGSVKLHANQVRGSFMRSGIFISEGLFSPTPSSFDARVYSNVVIGTGGGRGIDVTPSNGSIDVQLVNNTVTRVQSAMSFTNWDGGASPVVDALVRNNLLKAPTAMFVNPSLVAGVDDDYNLLDGATVNFTPGPNSLAGPAGLVSDQQPRPAPGSPAIDAADTATLGLGIIFNALPSTDADGLRRIKRVSASAADIGAFEAGDVMVLHAATPDTIGAHISRIDHPALNGRPAADLFATPNFDGDGSNPNVTHPHPYGSWYDGTRWTLFNEDLAPMPAYVDFNVFVPATGSGVFRHAANAANTSGWATQLDHASVNDLPDRIVLATQNFSAGPAYNAHPIGVFYFSLGGPGSWLIANLDLLPAVDMTEGAGFSVYAQEPSPNAFRVTASPGNLDGAALRLDHPLLDGMPCARPVATRMFDGSAVTTHFDLDYAEGHWHVFGFSPIPAGTQFNVLVDPAQVAACSDMIFADGFGD